MNKTLKNSLIITAAIASILAAGFTGALVGAQNSSRNQVTAQNGATSSIISGKDGIDGKNGADGKDGKDGITPQMRINETTDEWEVSYDNGETWVSLGVKATGKDGKDGKDGTNGADGKDGINGVDGKDGTDGKDGIDGKDGQDGKDGETPYIGENGNWWIGDADTGIAAQGPKGDKGDAGTDGRSSEESSEDSKGGDDSSSSEDSSEDPDETDNAICKLDVKPEIGCTYRTVSIAHSYGSDWFIGYGEAYRFNIDDSLVADYGLTPYSTVYGWEFRVTGIDKSYKSSSYTMYAATVNHIYSVKINSEGDYVISSQIR